jgi:hypothetical protein
MQCVLRILRIGCSKILALHGARAGGGGGGGGEKRRRRGHLSVGMYLVQKVYYARRKVSS